MAPEEESGEVDTELFLVVAHANGSIDIWWIFTSLETGNLVGEIICTKNAFPPETEIITIPSESEEEEDVIQEIIRWEIISAMKVQRLDSRVGK